MNELITVSDNGELTTTSVKLAERFNRTPSSVNRTIRNILKDLSCDEISLCNIAQSEIKNSRGKKIAIFEFNEEMAIVITGRLTGSKAVVAQMKLASEFIAMRNYIKSQQLTMSQEDKKMLAITRINPNTMKAISSTRNNNQVRSNYLALVGVGILEEVEEIKKVTRYRFTVDGLDYSSGYYHGIPRFDDSKHSLIMELIEEFAKKQLTAQSDLFIS